MIEDQKRSTDQNFTYPFKEFLFHRREVLKALATIPVIGIFFHKFMKKKSFDDNKRAQLLSELGLSHKDPEVFHINTAKRNGDLIRLGIIGFGVRGEQHARAAGFAHPGWIESSAKNALIDKFDKNLEDFLNQDDLNVVIGGICDVFDTRAEMGIETSKNCIGSGPGTRILKGAKRYRRYSDMLESKEIDAVMIATPDHLHAQMIIDAANAGKHIYSEKCMTKTAEDAMRAAEAVKRNKVVYQLGHQSRQSLMHMKAKEIIRNNILGNVTLIETATDFNYLNEVNLKIYEEGNSGTIDWEQFLGDAPYRSFDKKRFFQWRLWHDYSTGLIGDLFSHKYDTINQIMDLGIPQTTVASGGLYFFKDGREVPDVFNAIFEYPRQGLSLVYSATQASVIRRYRPRILFCGNDSSMELENGPLRVIVPNNPISTRYYDKIQDGTIDHTIPLFSYTPNSTGIDAVTSASEQYFLNSGLMHTYQKGKRVDTTYLHIKEWINCIRNGDETSCNIDRAVEEAVTCAMANLSYAEGRKVEWDPINKKVI